MIQRSPEVCIIEDLIRPNLVGAAYQVFQHMRIPPSTLYISVQELQNKDLLTKNLAHSIAPPLAFLLVDYCECLLYNTHRLHYERFDRFEIWTNYAIECPSSVVFHVDNDENHRVDTGEVRCPAMGSILYLGPTQPLKGGGTLFCLDDQFKITQEHWLFKSTPWSEVYNTLFDAALIGPFRAGRTVFFRGNLAHCVTPFSRSNNAYPRVSLLVNGWSRPEPPF